MGIQLAPPVVGSAAYLSLTIGTPDLVANMLFGYGLYQAVLLLRLWRWIRWPAFSASYWSVSFGATALPTMAMRMVERDDSGPIAWVGARRVCGCEPRHRGLGAVVAAPAHAAMARVGSELSEGDTNGAFAVGERRLAARHPLARQDRAHRDLEDAGGRPLPCEAAEPRRRRAR
jgi:hypothetical protein